jgi:hypothetical protein
MTQSENTHVKILFRYYSNVLEQLTVETMWATVVDEEKGWYKIDNIPFYGSSVASDDMVFAEYDESEQMLTYRETIQYSGNSIVQVVILDDLIQINDIRKVFEEMNCPSERVNDKYFSMEIPAAVDYSPIKKKLNELEEIGTIGYAEPCLSENHRTE